MAKKMVNKDITNFNPRSSCEERRRSWLTKDRTTEFQSTLLMRGATSSAIRTTSKKVFQSTLLMRGATTTVRKLNKELEEFQSTLLMRGATRALAGFSHIRKFQSTLLMRGATISSHPTGRWCHISIHAPHARSDVPWRDAHRSNNRFQSTLLMRGATPDPLRVSTQAEFQSTLLMRGATLWRRGRRQGRRISIHAPHARSDRIYRTKNLQSLHFNPRSSCEERQLTLLVYRIYRTFQSTLLMRGATRRRDGSLCSSMISIHAPHARSDLVGRCFWGHQSGFQSTLLMRGATLEVIATRSVYVISIHAPHARSDEMA